MQKLEAGTNFGERESFIRRRLIKVKKSCCMRIQPAGEFFAFRSRVQNFQVSRHSCENIDALSLVRTTLFASLYTVQCIQVT